MKKDNLEVWADIITGGLFVLARSMSLTLPAVSLDLEASIVSPEGDSDVGNASMELFEEGESEQRPFQLGDVSKTWRCWGGAVNVYTLIIDFKTTTILSLLRRTPRTSALNSN